MVKELELIELLQGKMDECDELIAEIAQLRYHIEDIVTLIQNKIEKDADMLSLNLPRPPCAPQL